MNFKLRSSNPINVPLTWQEMDDNLSYLLIKMSGSNVSISGSTGIKGNTAISGTLNLNNQLTVQHTSSLHNTSPELNNAYDLGSNLKKWRNIYTNNIVSTYMTASLISGSVTNAISASYASSSLSASYASSSLSASYASSSLSASYALTASYWSGSLGVSAKPIITIDVSKIFSDFNVSNEIITSIPSLSTADFPHILATNGTTVNTMASSNRVFITKGTINPDYDAGYNTIPNFQAKLVGQFSSEVGASWAFSSTVLDISNTNDFKITGLRLHNAGYSSLGGPGYFDFQYNYFYTASSGGDPNLTGGSVQIETEWMPITDFTSAGAKGGFLTPMYVNNSGVNVYIQKLTLFLQES